MITTTFMVISGHMTRPPMPGHRKPTSAEQQDSLQLDFPSAAKAISVPAVGQVPQRISGNMILLPIPGRREPTSEEQQDFLQPDFLSVAKGMSEPGGI